MITRHEQELGPGHHIPDKCPSCNEVNTLTFVPWDTEDMTDGQLADYEAGLYGTAVCSQCGHEFDWGY